MSSARPGNPPHLRHLASFTSGDVEDLRTRLRELLDLDDESWRALSSGARRAAVRLWSWDHVAGRIRELAAVAGDDGPGTGRLWLSAVAIPRFPRTSATGEVTSGPSSTRRRTGVRGGRIGRGGPAPRRPDQYRGGAPGWQRCG